jgi:hypothetical protein
LRVGERFCGDGAGAVAGEQGLVPDLCVLVQTDHVHLIVEADSRLALIRGVQGLAVRCAKAVNGRWGARARCGITGTTRAG